MPVTHEVDRERKTVFVKAWGEITIEDLIDRELQVVADPEFEKNFDTLLDLSEATPSHTVDIAKVAMSKDFVASIQETRGACKWAVYAPGHYNFAFADMFAVLSKDLIIETRVFRKAGEAEGWLGLQ